MAVAQEKQQVPQRFEYCGSASNWAMRNQQRSSANMILFSSLTPTRAEHAITEEEE
jgi:hypothetical protein